MDRWVISYIQLERLPVLLRFGAGLAVRCVILRIRRRWVLFHPVILLISYTSSIVVPYLPIF
jgi:hypothetical protein